MEFIFSIRKNVKEAWGVYKKHFWKLMFLMIVLVVVAIFLQDNFVLNIIAIILNLYISCIFVIYLLKVVKGEEVDLFKKEIIPSVKTVWYFFSTYFVYIILVMLGFILLIIPGIYISGRLLPSIFYTVDKNKDAISSIKDTWKMTEGYGWDLFWVYFKISIFSMLGFILLIIGVYIVTIPLGIILTFMLYRDFMKFKNTPSLSETPVVKEAEISQTV